MNENQQFDFLDLLNLLSFIIGIINLNENLTQNDKQDLMKTLDKETNLLLEEVHGHLKSQDEKLDIIIKRLENLA